jgi:peptidoglycan-associated lipoprotein
MKCVVAAAAVTLALGACSSGKKYHWERASRLDQQQPSEQAARPPTRPASAAVIDLTGDFVAYAGSDRVFFGNAGAKLSNEAKRVLDRQAQWLSRHPEVEARIEGNTDYRASDQHNFALGQRRAVAVKQYLVSHGVAAERIATLSNGATRPLASGKSQNALLRNRNAQTIIISVEAP